MAVHSLSVSLAALDGWLGVAERPAGLAPGLGSADLITALAIHALEPSLGELEWLQSVPSRDDLQFEQRPMPELRRLHAWLYAPHRRVACAVHTPDWQPSATPVPGSSGRAEPARTLGESRQDWDALLREHFHSGRGWTPISAVAMPLRVPFDEQGLKIWPLLALRSAVSPGEHWLSETMTTSVRHGAPDVVSVQVFSAALYVRALLAGGHTSIELVPPMGAVSVRG